MGDSQLKITVENINIPGQTSVVNAAKYQDMRQAMIQILPDQPPGLSHAEIKDGVRPFLDENLFPAGATSGWWSKTVQLDLEAKKIVARSTTTPMRWYRVQ